MRNLLLLLLLTFSIVFGQDITHGVGMKHGVVWTNVRNGNNTNCWYFSALNNPGLTCINVDNAVWSTANWTNINFPQQYFSEDCP